MSDEELLDAGEVGRRLKMSRTAVADWTRRGKIPCVRVSPRIIRYLWSEVWAALRAASGGGSSMQSRRSELDT